MFVKQLSIFVENKQGRLSAILATLSKHNIDICALSLADTTDFGVLRIIVDNPELAQEVLREEGVVSKTSEVLAVEMSDRPGALADILSVLDEGSCSVEYMYAFVGKKDNKALVVIKTIDLEVAEKLLMQNGIAIIRAENLYRNFQN